MYSWLRFKVAMICKSARYGTLRKMPYLRDLKLQKCHFLKLPFSNFFWGKWHFLTLFLHLNDNFPEGQIRTCNKNISFQILWKYRCYLCSAVCLFVFFYDCVFSKRSTQSFQISTRYTLSLYNFLKKKNTFVSELF